MPESYQHRLDRVRPPRVQITYDVEIGDAIVMKQLPFVGGILADLSGKPEEALPPLKQRKFVFIDRDNFNEVLAKAKPRLAFQVDNKLDKEEDTKLNVALTFDHIDDFEPLQVVRKVAPLSQLYEARKRLSDLLSKLDGNDDLDKLLQDVLQRTEGMSKTDELKKLKDEAAEGQEGESPEGAKAAQKAGAKDGKDADAAGGKKGKDAPAGEAPEGEGADKS